LSWRSRFLQCSGKCAASGRNDSVWDCLEKNANLRIVFCGLKDWNDGRLSSNLVDVGVGCFLLVLQHALDEWATGLLGVVISETSVRGARTPRVGSMMISSTVWGSAAA
jgi:hypothetical protein